MNDLVLLVEILLRLLGILAIILVIVGFQVWRDRRARRRAERRLAPVLQQQRTLNDAVVTYVRGVFDGLWPAARPDVLVTAYGPYLAAAAATVGELLSEAEQIPDWSQDDEALAARRIKLTMGRRHRELDDAAIDSLVAHVMYQRRQFAPPTGQ